MTATRRLRKITVSVRKNRQQKPNRNDYSVNASPCPPAQKNIYEIVSPRVKATAVVDKLTMLYGAANASVEQIAALIQQLQIET
ncbi:unnamed protein product [Echinostoma caproni]|uniref:Transposase n=1 Tax=Echinostoma caproni TaxID=27848 RepID=A0A183B5Q0_9TREM|nr:unnamed protein product [Echinostoma caproni]